MNLEPVDSSFISAIGHDPETDTLHVQMTNGKTYTYAGVDRQQHAELLKAKSIGQHFGRHIRAQYEATLVE